MRLYYYTSADYAVDDVKNERIKISLLDAVNDPNEWVPSVERAGLSAEAVREKILQNFNIEWGFISFSKSWNIAPMWGMYADKYKGVVLEFDIDNDLVKEVEYAPVRVVCKDNIMKDFEAEDFERLIRRKSSDWSYEQEVRRIVQLFPRNCDLVGSNYFAKIGVGKNSHQRIKLTAVRCGPLISQQNYGRLRYLQRLKKDQGFIPVIRTQFSMGNFALEEVR